MAFAVRKPYAFLIISFALLFRPSTIPAEMVPSAWSQLRIQSRWRHMVWAAFFIGSIFDRIVPVHHSLMNFPAQAG